ncbi:PREDICTED: receptor-transporting protein 4 [Dipodomys ordii]|uniref:Receptor-transporting protein 4 n=1 Tax=Dipodomys ordii TaxID=10020 RepID=A0A1S3GQI7_DIPOR|nr:PREDICTED: receptor-transporting protein 4 [Dipodomys ordii]
MPVKNGYKWEQKFQEQMRQEIPWVKWTLKLDKNITPDFPRPGWMQYQQRVFGRFLCALCNRSWTSAQIITLCHFYLDPWKSQGQVLMRIFAQKCNNCSSWRSENPEFSTKSVTRILKNLVQYILHVYYGYDFEEILVIWEVPLDEPPNRGNIVGFAVRDSLKHQTKSSLSLPSSQKSCRSSPRSHEDIIPEPQRPLTAGEKLMLFCVVMLCLILGQILH